MINRNTVRFLTSAGLICLSVSVHAQRAPFPLPDPDPKAELASFTVREGLEINLFAAEPMVVNPIHMNWDARGRLWIASSPIYPHIEPGAPANDKIYILEDTDGDGAADKSTVFADGLLIPTGILPDPTGHGAYVANSTQLLHLQDTDGDGKADKRRIVLSGFGTEDTHHILHTLRWGPDGAMYFNQSIYIHTDIETPYGVKRLDGSGIWRFRPESMQMEVVMRGLVNPWGHIFDRWGTQFATDGAGGEGINYVFPGVAYVSAVGVPRVLRGLNPGQPKHCSLEIIRSSQFPDDWQGTLIANDFRGNRINHFALSEAGSGFVSRQQPDLVTSTHMAFRPIDVKIGPDGALYVCDWYNPIIQHGEVDFRDPRRDHEHGRIWRITAKGRPRAKKPGLLNATPEQLVKLLDSPDGWTREHARLQLQNRGIEDVESLLHNWVVGNETVSREDDAMAARAIEGLWVLQGRRIVADGPLKYSLGHQNPNARAAAVRVLREWHSAIPESMSMLAQAITDDHPRVRLEAVCALREVGTPEAFTLALTALDRPVDEWIDYALWTSAREMKGAWLPAFKNDSLKFSKPDHMTFALRAVEDATALEPLIQLVREGWVGPVKQRIETIGLLGDIGDARAMRAILDGAAATPELREAAVQALVKAAQVRQVRPTGDVTEPLNKLRDDENVTVQALATRLMGLWGMDGKRPEIYDAATFPDVPPPVRHQAMFALADLKDAENLKALATGATLLDARVMAVDALATIDQPAAAAVAAVLLSEVKEPWMSDVLFNAFLRTNDGPDVLADALAGMELPPTVAIAGLRKAGQSGRPLPKLTGALEKAGGVGQMTQTLTPEQMQQLLAEVAQGDPHRGQQIYRRAELQCTVCHAIAGAGGKVGPDMVSLGASAPVDYIVESLLQPNAKIKEGYHMTVITTKAGGVVNGGLLSETDRRIILRDAAGNEINILKADIATKTIVPVSLMPPGLTASLRRDEFVDLVAFLAQLGKDGPFKSPAGQFVRSLQTLSPSGEIIRATQESNIGYIAEHAGELPWQPAYANVDAAVPMDALPVLGRFGSERYSYVRFAAKVGSAGRITLQLGDATGLTLWVNGRRVEPMAETPIELTGDQAQFVLAIDRVQRNAPLRMQFIENAGASGRVELITQ